jgi:hypothetical protein
MEPSKLKRRTILGLIAACLPVSRAASALDSALTESDSADRLLALFSDPASAASVGAKYLADRGDNADEATLLAELVAGDESMLARMDAMSPTGLRRYVREKIRQDFVAGRTESVDGWVLSTSELRLYALAAVKSA